MLSQYKITVWQYDKKKATFIIIKVIKAFLFQGSL